jgi:hypothetical protein
MENKEEKKGKQQPLVRRKNHWGGREIKSNREVGGESRKIEECTKTKKKHPKKGERAKKKVYKINKLKNERDRAIISRKNAYSLLTLSKNVALCFFFCFQVRASVTNQ